MNFFKKKKKKIVVTSRIKGGVQCQEKTPTSASESLTLFYFLAYVTDYTGVFFIDVCCNVYLCLCIFQLVHYICHEEKF